MIRTMSHGPTVCKLRPFCAIQPCCACSLSGYSVDITIPSLRVAIEADGPSHMSRNIVAGRGRVRLGATAMKRRHLQGLGWAVANISYEDWDTLANEEQRAAFLKQQLKSACAQLAAFGPVQRIGN